MANPEQGPAPRGNSEKRLVFDEKRGKWRMVSFKENGEINLGGHPPGQPVSPEHVRKRDEGLKQYWQKYREGTIYHQPKSQQHKDKIREGVKRYWQERRKQQ